MKKNKSEKAPLIERDLVADAAKLNVKSFDLIPGPPRVPYFGSIWPYKIGWSLNRVNTQLLNIHSYRTNTVKIQ